MGSTATTNQALSRILSSQDGSIFDRCASSSLLHLEASDAPFAKTGRQGEEALHQGLLSHCLAGPGSCASIERGQVHRHLISSHLTHLDRPSLSSNITRFRPCRGWFLLLRWREDAAARGEMLTVTSGVSVGDGTQGVMCWCSRRVKGGNEVGVQFRRAKT